MALPFSPACLPLPRGGAPFRGPQAALARAAGARGVATLAQRGPREAPLALGAAGFPGLSLDHERERASVTREAAERAIDRVGLAYLRDERSAGAPPGEQIGAMVEQLRQAEQSRPRMVKAELMGPVSLALQLTDEQEQPLAYDPPLREALVQHVALRAAWMHDLIGSAGASALICLDEPFLDALGSAFCPLDWEEGGDLLARALEDMPGPKGLCTAGAPNWPALVELPVDLLIFDAYEQGAGIVQAASSVAGFLERGGALGWGVVPTEPAALGQERAETLAQRLFSTVEYLAAAGGLAPEQIGAQSVVSTSGGLAHLPPALAEQAMDLCAEVATITRAMFGLET
jgi:hypothetical protein